MNIIQAYDFVLRLLLYKEKEKTANYESPTIASTLRFKES